MKPCLNSPFALHLQVNGALDWPFLPPLNIPSLQLNVQVLSFSLKTIITIMYTCHKKRKHDKSYI